MIRKFRLAFLTLICFVSANNLSAQQIIRYDLFVRDTLVNFTGKTKHAIAVNGQIPMPTLTFTEGDTAEIYVHNELSENTSLHWHGVFLPNQFDGVPYLTQMPIAPHTTHLYKFPIIQTGTHWYHSHTGLQEQVGMYGMMIFNKRNDDSTFRKGIDDLPTIPVILSEWTDMKPENIHRMLHNASDWFAIEKGSTQSYTEALQQGYLKTKLTNEWKRMNAMDVSDVYYNNFLLNGKVESIAPTFKSGDKVRLQIANAGASTNFWLSYSGGKITVVANDGNDVEPVEVDRMLIAVSETYDVIVTIPDSGSYEFLATSEDRTHTTSLWLGDGIKHLANPFPKLKYFEGMKMMNGMMKMNGNLDDMGMQMSLNQMDMNTVMYPEISGYSKFQKKQMKKDSTLFSHSQIKFPHITTLNYAMLKSTVKTNLPTAPTQILNFELTGNMNRYVWSLDNKVVSEADKILIHKGENVKMIIHNNSMMRHPMHLHGFDFRLLNGQGDYSPLKNIVDIMPMETDTLEFNANTTGDWFFHCHILYHMMSGMGRIYSVTDTTNSNLFGGDVSKPEISNPKFAQRKLFSDDRKFHFMFENDFATNGNDGMAMFANTRWSIGTEWRLGYDEMMGWETETHIGRYVGKMQWFMPFIGFDYRYRKMGIDEEQKNLFGQTNTKDNRAVASIGFNYTLPMLLIFQTEIFHDGKVRLQLMRDDIPVTKRLRMHFMLNTDKEYMIGFNYIMNKNFSIRTHYDSDMGFGAGISFKY